MITMRVASAVLVGVSMMGLAACGDEAETAAPAASQTTAAQTTAPPASAAATPPASAAAGSTTAAGAAPAGNAVTVACEQAEKAVTSFKTAILTLAQSGATELSPTDAKAMLTDFAGDLTKAAEGASGELAAALQANTDAALKAAADKDPANALDTPETLQAGKKLNALCKAAGVETTF